MRPVLRIAALSVALSASASSYSGTVDDKQLPDGAFYVRIVEKRTSHISIAYLPGEVERANTTVRTECAKLGFNDNTRMIYLPLENGYNLVIHTTIPLSKSDEEKLVKIADDVFEGIRKGVAK